MPTRLIKQTTDRKGRITKRSGVVKGFNKYLPEIERQVDWTIELNNYLRKHLVIRNWIIIILIIINLLSWR